VPTGVCGKVIVPEGATVVVVDPLITLYVYVGADPCPLSEIVTVFEGTVPMQVFALLVVPNAIDSDPRSESPATGMKTTLYAKEAVGARRAGTKGRPDKWKELPEIETATTQPGPVPLFKIWNAAVLDCPIAVRGNGIDPPLPTAVAFPLVNV